MKGPLRLLAALPLCALLCSSLSAQNLLFVRTGQTSYTWDENEFVTQFQNWGYTVTPIWDNDSQGNFDAAVSSSDVVYIAPTVTPWELLYKLRTATTGIVHCVPDLDEEYGFALSSGWYTNDSHLDNVDNSHDVTAGLASGDHVQITNGSYPFSMPNGSLASGMTVLATAGGSSLSIGVIEAGGTLANDHNGNSTASGRRVRMPYGGPSFEVGYFNAAGLTILQNALTWASGTGGGGGGGSNGVYLSTDNSSSIGGVSLQDEDLVEYDPSGGTATMRLDGSATFTGTPPDINAVHVFSDGVLYLSCNASGTLAGVSFQDEDILRYDTSSGTATTFFDGTSIFSTNTDVDALFIKDNGHILLSTTDDTSIGALSFSDEDVVDYDPVSGTATLVFNGSAIFSSDEDLDAVYLLDNGNLLISCDTTAQIGGLSFNDEDVVEYNGSSASFYFNGSSHYAGDEDTNAFSLIDDPPGDGLIAHWTFDEGSGSTIADSSDSGQDASFSSGTPTWVTGVRGTALQFDGSNDEADTDTAFDPPEVGTIAFWFRANGAPASRERLFGSGGSWEIRFETDGTLAFDIGSGGGFPSTSSFTIPNRWYHVALVYSQDSGTYTVYVDGDAKWSDSFTFTTQSANTLTFGTRTGSSDNFAGALDDLRVYNKELSPAEIAKIYGLVGHWKLDESGGSTAADSSLVGNDGTFTGDAAPGAAGPYPSLGVESCEFSGSGEITVPHHDAYNITDTFTAASWVRCNPWTDFGEILKSGSSVAAFRLGLGVTGGENVFRVMVNNGALTDPGAFGHWLSYSSDQQLDTWCHVAIVSDGSYVRLYINGVEYTNWSHTDGFGTHAEGLVIGKYLTGRLFDVRLYNRALKQWEVAELYGLVGNWKLTDTSGTTATDSSGMAAHGTYTGGVTLNQTGPKATLVAATFDGVDGHVVLPDYPIDFTEGYAIAVWARTASSAYWARFLELGNGQDDNNILLSRFGTDATLTNTLLDGSLGGTQRVNATDAIVNNEWHHYAASVSSSGFSRVYVDGVEVATGGVGTPSKAPRQSNFIGRSNWAADADFHGDMYDVRLYNRPISLEEVTLLYESGTTAGPKIIRWVESR